MKAKLAATPSILLPEVPANTLVRLDRKLVSRPFPIHAVGDLHGNYNALIGNMASLGLINAQDDWVGGAARVSFLGDMIADRNGNDVEIALKLLTYGSSARREGGQLPCLAGDHEWLLVSLLALRDIDGQSPIHILQHKGQGVGALGLLRYFRQYHDIGDYHNTSYFSYLESVREKLVDAMSSDQASGRKYLTFIQSLKIAEHFDDSLFLHSPPTNEMIDWIKRYNVAELNKIFKTGLQAEIGGRGAIPSEYLGMAKAFLRISNREPFSDIRLADTLRDLGINQVIYAHNATEGGKVTIFDNSLRLLCIDYGSYQSIKFNEARRSIATITKNGDVYFGAEQIPLY